MWVGVGEQEVSLMGRRGSAGQRFISGCMASARSTAGRCWKNVCGEYIPQDSQCCWRGDPEGIKPQLLSLQCPQAQAQGCAQCACALPLTASVHIRAVGFVSEPI